MKFPVSKLKKEEAIYLGDQYSPFFMSNHTRILPIKLLRSTCIVPAGVVSLGHRSVSSMHGRLAGEKTSEKQHCGARLSPTPR
jgi:hypothetical protein